MGEYRDKSYWLRGVDPEPEEPLRGEETCDVAIVGGGFTGMATALCLKTYDASIDVCVCEQEVVGYGASGRNAGFSMTLFGLTLSMTALRFGEAKAAEAHRYMDEAVDLVRELVDEYDIDSDYEHPGFLRVATSATYEKRLKKELALAEKLDLEGLRWMEADAVREEVRSPLFRGALQEDNCGLIDPAKQVRELKRIVEGMGVEIYEATPVTEVGRRAGGVRLETPHGGVEADRAVLATNAYSHKLDPIKRKQIPAFTYIVLTEPISEDHLAEIGWHNRQGLEDARNMVHYFRRTPDNRILMGGRDVGITFGDDMDRDRDSDVFRGLREDLREMFPVLEEVAIDHCWGGPVSITLDMAPAIGFVGDERIIYSIGCMGHGVSLTHQNGRTIAELILGRETRRTDAFFVGRRVLPWPPEPLRYAASQAVRSYMKLEDYFLDPS